MDSLDSIALALLLLVVAAVGFVAVLEGWRRWSDNRGIRKHLRN
jgi:hypothetical protein